MTEAQQKLHDAISVAVDMLQLHSSDMTPVFDWWAKWSREATAASDQQLTP